MECIKTGCWAYVEPYGSWVYGDAFECNSVFLFRISHEAYLPYPDRHFTIHSANMWFDKDGERVSTLVSCAVVNHGYRGVPDPLYKEKEESNETSTSSLNG